MALNFYLNFDSGVITKPQIKMRSTCEKTKDSENQKISCLDIKYDQTSNEKKYQCSIKLKS